MEYTIEEFDKAKTKVMNYIMYKKRTEYEVRNKFSKTLEEKKPTLRRYNFVCFNAGTRKEVAILSSPQLI